MPCQTARFRFGEGWIRTIEGYAGRFTVCSLWPLGNLTDKLSWREELNPQHVDYKSTALPIELRQRLFEFPLLIYGQQLSNIFLILFI
jgi:hypothetical protein